MVAIRHTGIYVDDIDGLEEFYKSAFDMTTICSKELDRGRLFDELLGSDDSLIMTTKLITPYGKLAGQGDMVELVKVMSDSFESPSVPNPHPIFMIGMGHIAFGVTDIEDVVSKIISAGGNEKTNIVEMKNGNKCCFCTDPEGNWIELIQRKQ